MRKHLTTFALTMAAVAVVSVLSTFAFAQSSSGTQTTPPEEFRPSGKFTMQFFGDWYYQIGASDSIAKRGSQYYSATQHYFQAFDIRRVYLGYDYNFTKDVSTQLLFSHENGQAASLTSSSTSTLDTVKNTVKTTTTTTVSSGDIVLDGNRGIYIKAANIRWKNAIPYSTVIFGQQGTAAFALTEQLWGYRSIEKTVMDARGMAQSNDLGIQLTGGIDNASTLGYSVMISNGNGAKAESDRYKKYAAEVNTKLLDNKLIIELYGDIMDLSQSGRRTTLKGLLGLALEPISAGVEYAMQTQSSSLANVDDITPNAISVFARGFILPKQLNWFARYDMWNQNTKITASGYKENFITAGLDWIPTIDANVHVIPNVWVNTYNAQGTSPKIDADLVGRLTFFYKF